MALLFTCGCAAIFPKGAYWRPYGAHLASPPPAARKETAESPRALPSAADLASRRAALQANITRRWADEDLVQSARGMEGWAGRRVYDEAMQILVWCYVDPLTYRRLIVSGLESLRAALENAEFCRRFPAAADDAKRERLAEALDILILKAGAADPWFSFQAADWLAAVMEKNRAMLGLPDGAVVGEFLFGAMDGLDPYTRYLTAEMSRLYDEQIEGAYVGIGAEVVQRDGRCFLKEVFEGGAAAKAGLKAGDEIVAVAGRPVAGLVRAEVGRRLRGREGTEVKVSVRAGGEGAAREVRLVRAPVRLPDVRDVQVLDAAKGVGYLRLTVFNARSDREVRRAIRDLAGRGAKRLILDLRDNPGGSLLDAVTVVGVFLPKGLVLKTRGRVPGATWTYDVPAFERPAWGGDLVILINENTASAAEIVAASLARHGRATLVGKRTFGKGAVQIAIPVGGGAVCVTIARVYDPKNECLEGRGVAPALAVEAPAPPPATVKEDAAVRAAMSLMEKPTLSP
ncbi:MAG: S41 family peptidase [Planctomycetota bacterium]|nr:S41 family peptidase [Planctomycetota bacterium]